MSGVASGLAGAAFWGGALSECATVAGFGYATGVLARSGAGRAQLSGCRTVRVCDCRRIRVCDGARWGGPGQRGSLQGCRTVQVCDCRRVRACDRARPEGPGHRLGWSSGPSSPSTEPLPGFLSGRKSEVGISLIPAPQPNSAADRAPSDTARPRVSSRSPRNTPKPPEDVSGAAADSPAPPPPKS